MKLLQDDDVGMAGRNLPEFPRISSDRACPGQEAPVWWSQELDDFIRDRFSTTLEDPQTGRRVRG